MKLTEAELQSVRERASKPRNGHASLSNAETLFYLQQAGVQAALLTGSPEWDRFLSQMQFWVDATREQANAFRSALENPYLTEDQARNARRDLILCNERIAVLEAVIKFPSQAQQAGEQAKLELEAIGSKAIAQTDT